MVERFRTSWPKLQAATDAKYPLGRTMHPDEVANVQSFIFKILNHKMFSQLKSNMLFSLLKSGGVVFGGHGGDVPVCGG